MNRKRYIISLLCILGMSFISRGQTIPPIDIRIGTGAGAYNLNIESELDMTSKSSGFLNPAIFIQADYYLNENVGVGIGLEGNSYRFDNTLSDYAHSYTGVDNWEGDPTAREYEFFIGSNETDIVEQARMNYLGVPVSMVYLYALNEKIGLTGRGGLKISFPLSGSYRLEGSNLKTRLYFEEWDLELFEVPAHGLYESRTDWHPGGDLKLKTAISAFAEIGLGYQINAWLNTRVSAYFSYGLNGVIDETQSSLIYWRNDYNSMLTLSEKASLQEIGIKLSFSFNRSEKVKDEPDKGQQLPIM